VITAERASELLSYNPITGEFRWRVDRPNGIKAGDIAGHVKQGRRWLNLDGRRYASGRIAWLMATGHHPRGEIDHVDGDALNNALSNLRDVPRKMNARNKRLYRNNRTGYPGVKKRSNGKYQACIGSSPRTHLGTFTRLESAILARRKAERRMGYTSRHGSNA